MTGSISLMRLKLTALGCLLICQSSCDVTASKQVPRAFDQFGTCYKHSQSENGCENIYSTIKDSNIPEYGSVDEESDEKATLFYSVDSRFQGVYTFPVKPIPRKDCSSDDAMQYLQQGLPVVLENCTFHRSALKWTTDYLVENLQDENHTAYLSKNRKFLYYDEDRIKGNYKLWEPPHNKKLMFFKQFVDLAKELETASNGSRAYFQSVLYMQEGVSSSMVHDIDSFDYTWLFRLVTRMNWGQDVTNLLLVGMPDVVTPAHYDTLENLYVQISGRKRVILFNPEWFRSLYPYPVGHPHDRQTQVDFDDPDFNRFPRFREIEGMEVALEPGEVLYIPSYWWHYIESERENKTVSVNFWFEPTNKSEEQKDQEKSTTAPTYSGNEEEQSEQGKPTMEKPKHDDPTQDNTGETGNEKRQAEKKEEHAKEDQQSSDKESSEKIQAEKEEENAKEDKQSSEEESKEEEEKEVHFKPSDYLALMREIEAALFKATFSHKMVKQILEEMLSGRFNNL